MFEATFTTDESKNQMMVLREFNAPREKVWRAWTESELLDKWWAPKPWKAVTQKMNFTEGGEWRYYMEGPEGERHYCLVEYKKIQPQESITAVDAFCDENGVKNEQLPVTNWHNQYTDMGQTTKVLVTLSFSSKEQMAELVKMGFKEGFSMGLQNLDELLKEMK